MVPPVKVNIITVLKFIIIKAYCHHHRGLFGQKTHIWDGVGSKDNKWSVIVDKAHEREVETHWRYIPGIVVVVYHAGYKVFYEALVYIMCETFYDDNRMAKEIIMITIDVHPEISEALLIIIGVPYLTRQL